MKKYFIIFLSLLLTAAVLLACITAAGGAGYVKSPEITITVPETSAEAAAITTAAPEVPIVTEPETDVRELTLSEGETDILALPEADEKLLESWSSDDEAVVSVDSGGRIDALSVGKAAVTAAFLDQRKTVYKITVNKSSVSAASPKLTTAITDNEDVVKENKKSSSKPLYQLFVNRSQNVVTVYTHDSKGRYNVPVRAMVCSCGMYGATITGEFQTYFRAEWHALYNGVYGQYVTGISGDYLFHSVPYEDLANDALELEEYNKLGEDASLGCVRLSAGDAKWIYDNCENGTVVKIYDSDDPEPLGKPEAIRVTDMSCGWDPTDPDKRNPYLEKSPAIIGAEDITIAMNGEFNPLESVTAVDTCGNDISGRLTFEGNVVTSRAGKYRVTYSVEDALSRRAEKTVTVTVE